MNEPLSSDTRAILLLTAPLIGSRRQPPPDLLSPSEYGRLAQHLRTLGAQPADLLGPSAERLIEDCSRVVESERLERLLARGFALGQAVERWQARAIWVVSRADSGYPQRLKARLKES